MDARGKITATTRNNPNGREKGDCEKQLVYMTGAGDGGAVAPMLAIIDTALQAAPGTKPTASLPRRRVSRRRCLRSPTI